MAKSKRPGLHSTLLRVPDQLWEQLVARAKAERRSATQHIVWLIEQDLQAAAPAQDGLAPSGPKSVPKRGKAKK
jgi:site-specific recombinase XerC